MTCWRCKSTHVTHLGFPTVEARMRESLHECHLPLCNDCSKAVLIAAWGLLRLEPTGRYNAILGDPSTLPPPAEPDVIPLTGYLTVRPPGDTEGFLKEYLAIVNPEPGREEEFGLGQGLEDTGVFNIQGT